MSTITLSKRAAEAILDKHDDFTIFRSDSTYWRDLEVSTPLLSDEALNIALTQFKSLDTPTTEEKASTSIIEAILRTRAGEDKPVASLRALPSVVSAWVDTNAERGWLIYKDRSDSKRDQAYLAVTATLSDKRDSEMYVSVSLVANAPGLPSRESGGKNGGRVSRHISIHNDDMFTTAKEGEKRKRRTVAQIMEAEGFFLPSAEDLAAHDSTAKTFEALLGTGFAKQYRHTGHAQSDSYSYKSYANENAKVIHDVAPSERTPNRPVAVVWNTDRNDDPIVRKVPIDPSLRAFDLIKQRFIQVDARDLSEYQYDKTLRQKLVLPATHRELLDVLTTDLEDYSDDIVEGKSAGNVILAQGRPGVGKTLTAEVYSEIVERPLYSIHSGSLGTTAEDVRKNLEVIFARSNRWDTVLLLDEADVFVIERGQSVEQNAIVAEFLRTMEYFKGLLFMTTNRSDAIDDAILSRCAAIIQYDVPERDDARKVWDVLVRNAGATDLVDDALIESILTEYPGLAPRDIKMVLRLALRIATKREQKPDLAIFERCILFRGLTDAAKAGTK